MLPLGSCGWEHGGVDQAGGRGQSEDRVPGLLQITEQDVVESGPRVRALLVSRYEAAWDPIKDHLSQVKDGLMPPDARLLEIGLRILKDEAQLYRLTRAPVAQEQEEQEDLGAGVDRRALVESHLAEIEQKLRGSTEA